jgi:hypothetical protein
MIKMSLKKLLIMEISLKHKVIIEPLELGIQEWVEGRIIELDCSEDEYGLSGSIPESIGYLTELTRLELGDNQSSE